MAVKENIGAQFYRECSAKAGAGVLEIFKDIALAPNLRLTATTERIESTLSWGSDKKSCC
jgi:hypothetical protein